MTDTAPLPQRVFLAGFWDEAAGRPGAESLLAELAALAQTLAFEVAGTMLIRSRAGRSLSVGRGKAAEIAEACERLGATQVIFDGDISPSRQRELEKLCGVTVSDRRELIINIFAARARTREARLQAELAQLRFRLPRLTHKYENLERQRGGSYGAKGAGETHFETDRRNIERRVRLLEKEIESVRASRAVQRARREKERLPVCALVGYTNAGKSSLLNRLCAADVYAADKLFATLDTTSRRLAFPLPGGGARYAVLTDTVGFIRRLPHDLVTAFRSTLEEAAYASLLIHVIDASSEDALEQARAACRVLRELGAGETPAITVFNKADRPAAPALEAALADYRPIRVSALRGDGIGELLAAIERRLWGV